VNVGTSAPATLVGRYAVFEEIASGGMASVHYGRLMGPSGFSRTVAIKRLHPHLARDAEFSAMFLDEARVAARVRHPNVVPTLDIVSTDGELFLVMEYVQGESLSRLLRAARKNDAAVPPAVAAAIIVGVLHGLHAAHEAVNERGQPLGIVHRDVSPQNVLVGLDGIPRLVDFGVAKAIGRVQTTRDGQIKGKIAYMAPEQIRGATPTRLVDVYAAAIVFWEMLTGERLFGGDNDVTVLERALHHDPEPPSKKAEGISPALDAVVLRGLAREPEKRFQTARDMLREIENVTSVASVSKVGEWVESIAGDAIAERAAKVAEIESHSQIRALQSTPPPPGASAPAVDNPPTIDVHEALPSVPPLQRRRRMLATVVGGVVGVAALVTIAAFAMHRTTGSSAAQPSVTTTASTAPSLAAQATPPETTPAAVATPPETAAPATASASAKPTAVTHPPKPAHPHGTIIRQFPTSHAAVKPGCNPPYTIDANGVKQYKVQCL
jgi:serine/threonine protein kinase